MENSVIITTPRSNNLEQIIATLADWQQDRDVIQLHPGDIGWFQRFGEKATSDALRLWEKDGQLASIGMMDGSDLLRIALNPAFETDTELAEQMAKDIDEILEAGACLEARSADLLRKKLSKANWKEGEPWTSLALDLTESPKEADLEIKEVGEDQVTVRTSLQRASFDNSTFTEDNWRNMASGPAYKNARCLIGYDTDKNTVAMVTVWSAGEGRPGLIEPLGVDKKFRGNGYGKAITLAAAKALEEMGSSSVLVCTESSNVGAVNTYKSAGFRELPDIRDLVKTI